jgi:hypothetical protein
LHSVGEILEVLLKLYASNFIGDTAWAVCRNPVDPQVKAKPIPPAPSQSRTSSVAWLIQISALSSWFFVWNLNIFKLSDWRTSGRPAALDPPRTDQACAHLAMRSLL